MLYTTLSQLRERHNEIVTSYKKALPFYSRGREKHLFFLFLFFVWCFVWFESAYRYLNLDYVYYNMKDPRIIIIPLFIILFGFYIFKPQRIYTNRTLFGKIEAIEKQGAYTISKDETGKIVRTKKLRRRIFDGTNIITVRIYNGKLKNYKVPNVAKFDMLYDIDSSVSIISGEKFPVQMDKNLISQGKYFCTRCSSFEESPRTYCSSCHSRLWYINK